MSNADELTLIQEELVATQEKLKIATEALALGRLVLDQIEGPIHLKERARAASGSIAKAIAKIKDGSQ